MIEPLALPAVIGIKGVGAAVHVGGSQGPARKTALQDRSSGDSLALSPEAQRLLAELKATDARVRAHEAAHVAAGAGVVRGGASFTTTRGPDGKQYAVAGEVAIDTGGVPGDPRATLAKAQQIQAAALAPADPSAQDRAVAAAAASLAAQAQIELSRQSGVSGKGTSGSDALEGAQGLQLDLLA